MVIMRHKFSLIGVIGGILLLLAILLIVEAIEAFEAKYHVRQIVKRMKR